MKLSLLILIPGIATYTAAQETVVTYTPAPLAETDFNALKGQSPFLRSVNLSDSLILTGIAMVNNEQVATLMNKETKETFVVSSQLNSQGWKMVDLKSDGDLEKVAAKVAIEGGEVVTVRYAEWQLKPGESKPGAGPSTEAAPGPGGGERRRGFGGPGGPGGQGGASSEFREKMSQLSEEQRQKMFNRMRELREKNPDMSREDMGREMSGVMDKMLRKQK